MKQLMTGLLILFLGTMAGCRNSVSKATVADTEGRKLEVVVPPNGIKVTQGKAQDFSVTARREKFDDDVTLDLDNPLEKQGLTFEGKRVIPKGKNATILTVKAAENAPVQANIPIKITASAKELDRAALMTLKVTIEQSLKSKEAEKEQFIAASKKRFKALRDQLKDITTRAKDASTEFNKAFFKTLSRRESEMKKAKDKFAKLEAEPVDSWESRRGEVDRALQSLESAIAGDATQLEMELKKRKK
jgi:hypothetical protein